MSRTSSAAPAAEGKPKGRSGKRKGQAEGPTPRDVALDMLQSALNYCQDAGLAIGGQNDAGRLILALDGVHLVGDKLVLISAAAPEPPAIASTGDPAPAKRSRRKKAASDTGNLPAAEVAA